VSGGRRERDRERERERKALTHQKLLVDRTLTEQVSVFHTRDSVRSGQEWRKGEEENRAPVIVALTTHRRQETELLAGHAHATVVIFADLFVDCIETILEF
jgi:hypothetical protein